MFLSKEIYWNIHFCLRGNLLYVDNKDVKIRMNVYGR